MKTWKIVFLFGMICLGPMINGAYGAGNEEHVTLETVVVTGTRAEQKIERVPANVTVIDQEDIKNSNAKNVVDLLRTEEGILVVDPLGNGKTSRVDLRGFGETASSNTLVLVDGRRINEIDLSGVDWAQIPVEQIERIEVVRGTGTVLYGDNAVGGVINIITKIPPKKLTLSAGTTAGSYRRNKEQISISGGGENLGAALFASYDSTNGYRDNGEFQAKDVGGKIVFDATEFLSLDLSGSYHSDENGLPGDLSEQELGVDRRAARFPFDEAESKDGYLKLGGDLDLGRYGSIVAGFSYRDRKSEAQFVGFTAATDSETETWGITPRYVWSGKLFNRANTLIAGVDIYLADREGKSFFGTPLALTGVSDIERDSYGAYFNNEFSLLENLTLSVGARREQVKYHLKQEDLTGFFAPLDETVTQRENAYSTGLTFLYSGKSSVFVRANQSLRFPLTDELVVFDFFVGQIRVNSELKPQRGKHYEVGVRHYFTPDIQGDVTLYRAEIKDEIFFNRPAFANENHPMTLHQGVEIGSKAELLKKLILYGNYTYTKATFEQDPFNGKDIPAIPRDKANLGFRIHDLVPGLIFAADYNFVGASFLLSDLANEFEKLEEYYTIDARLSYAWRWLKAFLGVNNITNKEYSEFAGIGRTPVVRTFFPAPERNWLAGLEIAF